MNSKRVNYIDVSRGITIILMIIGHIVPYHFLVRRIIFSFHMPLFIIVSGYFFLPASDNRHIKFSFRAFNKILIPYILTLVANSTLLFMLHGGNILSYLKNLVLQIIFSYSYSNRISFGSIQPVGVLWFIPFLACCKLIFALLYNSSNGHKKQLFFKCILFTCFGVLIGRLGFYLPFSLDVAFASTFFIYIGYVFKKYNLIEFVLARRNYLFIIFFVWVLGWIKFIELAVRSYPAFPLCFISAICGTIIVLKISKLIEPVKIVSPCLQWLGKNSILILCFHQLDYLIDYAGMGITNLYLLIVCKIFVITVGAFLCYKIVYYMHKMKLLPS